MTEPAPPIDVAGLVLEYSDLTEAQRDAMIEQMVACFAGLPGVVGAPMITGTEFWADVARHLIELGWRWAAEPIKTYSAPSSLERAEAAGTWVYADPGLAPEDPKVRYARIHEAEQTELQQRIAAMREAGELPPEGLSAQAEHEWRQKRQARREKTAFSETVRRRKIDGSYADSPLAQVNTKKKRKGKR